MTLFGVENIEQLVLTPLVSCLMSPINLNIFLFLILCHRTGGTYPLSLLVAEILLIIPALMSF